MVTCAVSLSSTSRGARSGFACPRQLLCYVGFQKLVLFASRRESPEGHHSEIKRWDWGQWFIGLKIDCFGISSLAGAYDPRYRCLCLWVKKRAAHVQDGYFRGITAYPAYSACREVDISGHYRLLTASIREFGPGEGDHAIIKVNRGVTR